MLEFETKISDINYMMHSIDNGFLHWEWEVVLFYMEVFDWAQSLKKKKNFWHMLKVPLRLVVVNTCHDIFLAINKSIS